MTHEPAVENPHFSLPETFHNALSFRNYENHGFSTSITNLLDTFIVQNDHNNSHSHQRIPRGGQFDTTASQLNESDFCGNNNDIENSPADFSHLRKNTPKDFPLIVRQAMQKQDVENTQKFAQRPKIPRQNAIFQSPTQSSTKDQRTYANENNDEMSNDNAIEPDTPSIEDAPKSIDFLSAVKSYVSNDKYVENVATDEGNENTLPMPDINLNQKRDVPPPPAYTAATNRRRSLRNSDSSGFSSNDETEDDECNEDFLNNINALKLDDDDDEVKNENKTTTETDVNSNVREECSFDYHGDDDDDEDDESDDDNVFRQFNSHQYWYISPDIPVDMDIFLEPEEKSTLTSSEYFLIVSV